MKEVAVGNRTISKNVDPTWTSAIRKVTKNVDEIHQREVTPRDVRAWNLETILIMDVKEMWTVRYQSPYQTEARQADQQTRVSRV